MSSSTHTYTLPSLPYDYDALEPVISQKIMTLHHGAHHKTYIANLNAALSSLAQAQQANDIPAQIALQPAIRFNGGGHINHCLFWANMAPESSADTKLSSAAPKLSARINEIWGSEEKFVAAFEKAFLGIQGSGWAWLVKVPGEAGSSGKGGLKIVTTANQESVVGADESVVLACDGWEHSWYLDYLNDKKTYLKNWWRIVNWKVAEERFGVEREEAFKKLRAMM